ncbi:MAG: elongation factor Ts, partial [Muribaculaceae bacterium]|nr:elongation factor Ts [Muribaculaceae bacterium]
FRALTKKILDAAVEAGAKTLDEVKALPLEGRTVAELVTDEIGKTGEKMELGAYECVEAPSVAAYEHLGNKLATIVGLSIPGVSTAIGREICMQVAAMNPIAIDRDHVDAHVVESELSVAIEKTKEEQVKKAVEAAIRKAGINPNLVDSADHVESNIAKGWLTREEADKAAEIAAKVGAEKAANLPEAMIQNIANGRLNKFFKENCLMEQEYHRDAKLTVGQYLDSEVKGCVVVDFKRVNLNQD